MNHALTFITSHPKKAAEISALINIEVKHYNYDLPEIQSLDPIEVVMHKAHAAYDLLKQPVLVEDFSLTLDAFGKLPGPLFKWFLVELKPDGVCQLLNGNHSRGATAATYFGYCDAQGPRVFEGSLQGSIAIEPKGEYGYGSDSIFIPAGQAKTWSEMNPAEQERYSIRRVGLQKLEKYLRMRSLAKRTS